MAFLNNISTLVDASQWLGQSSTNKHLPPEMLVDLFRHYLALENSSPLPYATFPIFRSSMSFSSHSLIERGNNWERFSSINASVRSSKPAASLLLRTLCQRLLPQYNDFSGHVAIARLDVGENGVEGECRFRLGWFFGLFKRERKLMRIIGLLTGSREVDSVLLDDQ